MNTKHIGAIAILATTLSITGAGVAMAASSNDEPQLSSSTADKTTISVTGKLIRGVENGCLLLRTKSGSEYQLIPDNPSVHIPESEDPRVHIPEDGDPTVHIPETDKPTVHIPETGNAGVATARHSSTVTYIGHIDQNTASFCGQGTPFRVIEVTIA